MRIEFPLAPLAWSRPRLDTRYGAGHGFRKPELEAYQDAVKLLGQQAMAVKGLSPMQGALVVYLDLYLARPKTVKRAFPCVIPDADNFFKAIADAANGVFWKDDGQLCDIHIRKRYTSGSARFVLTVDQLTTDYVERM